MFRVRKYPSAIIKAKIGKASLPTFVIQCWPVKIVAHKWSNSMNAIARTCRPKEVIPIFPLSKLINFFIPLSLVIIMSTAARKQANPCFPTVYELISAKVYHGKRIISTEFDTRTGTGGFHATGQRPDPGLGQEEARMFPTAEGTLHFLLWGILCAELPDPAISTRRS